MAAWFWYVLSLPAFSIPALAGRMVQCVANRFDSCEAWHMGRVGEAVEEGFGLPFYDKMCGSIKELLTCAAKECRAEDWDRASDYITRQLQFSEAAGLCGAKAQTNRCSRKIAKKCLRKMARSIVEDRFYCDYYLVYARCAIAELPACDDATASAFVEEMKRQVQEQLPIVAANEVSILCKMWSTDQPVLEI